MGSSAATKKVSQQLFSITVSKFSGTFKWSKFLELWYIADLSGHEKHNQLRAAYSYWNVATTVPLQDGVIFFWETFWDPEFEPGTSGTSLGKFRPWQKKLRLAQLGKTDVQDLMYDALILAKKLDP